MRIIPVSFWVLWLVVKWWPLPRYRFLKFLSLHLSFLLLDHLCFSIIKLNNRCLIVCSSDITILQSELVTMLSLCQKGSLTIRCIVRLMLTSWLCGDQTSHLFIRFAGVLHRHLLLWVLWKVTDFYLICHLLMITNTRIWKKSSMKIATIIIFLAYYIPDRLLLILSVINALWVGVGINVVLLVVNILLLAILLGYLHFEIVWSHLSKTYLLRSKFIKIKITNKFEYYINKKQSELNHVLFYFNFSNKLSLFNLIIPNYITLQIN